MGGFYPPCFSKSRTLSQKSHLSGELMHFNDFEDVSDRTIHPIPLSCTCFLDHIIWNILYPVQGGSESQKTSNQRRWNRAIFVSSNMAARKKQTILDMNCFFGQFPACPYVFLQDTVSYSILYLSTGWPLLVFERNTRKVSQDLPSILARYPSSHNYESGKWVPPTLVSTALVSFHSG